MKPTYLVIYGVTSLLLTTPSFALQSVKPGLWEHKYHITSESGQIEQAIEQAKTMLATLPPEQKKMVQDMLARQGISMDFAGATVKMCLSEEQAKGNRLPQLGQDCKQEVLSSTDTEMKIRFDCQTQPPSSGEGTVTILSDSAYKGEIKLNTTINGQADKLNATTEGNWVSADCGDLPPVNANK